MEVIKNKDVDLSKFKSVGLFNNEEVNETPKVRDFGGNNSGNGSDIIVAENVQKINTKPKIVTTDYIDFSRFEFENFIENNLQKEELKIMELLKKNGISIYLKRGGIYTSRFDIEDGFIEVDNIDKLIKDLNRKLKIRMSKEQIQTLVNSLMLIEGNIFEPTMQKEFIEIKNNKYCLNTFKPSNYMRLKNEDIDYKEPKAILKLIDNLVNNNLEDREYLLNWLSCFFCSLKKSQVAIILRGDQGAGKGILFNEIITPLFGGDDYCSIINDDNLATNFKATLFQNKLFYNIDELSEQTKKIKSFIKSLIVSSKITLEAKNQNITKPTAIYGNVIITTNEYEFLQIEPNDRRFSMFITGKQIKRIDFLGYGSGGKLVEQIKSELPSFVKYLRDYPKDYQLYNTALDNEAKQGVINNSTDPYTLFANALKDKDMNFFVSRIEDDEDTLKAILQSFESERIYRSNIPIYFQKCFKFEKISSNALYNRLGAIHPKIFSKVHKYNGDLYYLLS